MTAYKAELLARIYSDLKGVIDDVGLDIHPTIIGWMAETAYESVEDELRGPA